LRRINDILKLPIGELTDEEICKAAMHRLGTDVCTLIYKREDGVIQYLIHWRNKAGRSFWNKIEIGAQLLFNRVYNKILDRFGDNHPAQYK